LNQELLLKEKLQTVQEISLKEKLHLMAETIRNHQGIEQGRGCLINCEKENTMCVYGLLGWRAGIPRDTLKGFYIDKYGEILKKYGITKEESRTPLINHRETHYQLFNIFALNDNGHTFDQLADILDETAEALK